MDKDKINSAIENLCGLNQKEWDKVRMIVSNYFRLKTNSIADKIELTCDTTLEDSKKDFSL